LFKFQNEYVVPKKYAVYILKLWFLIVLITCIYVETALMK